MIFKALEDKTVVTQNTKDYLIEIERADSKKTPEGNHILDKRAGQSAPEAQLRAATAQCYGC